MAIEKALAKKPEDRSTTVRAFVEALRGTLEVTRPTRQRRTAFAEATTTPVPVRPRRRWGGVLLFSAVAGAALGGATLLVLNRGEGGPRRQPATSAPETSAAPAPAPSAPVAEERTRVPIPSTQPPTGPPAPRTGRLTVSGLPAGGTVVIDGQRRSGNSFELAAGSYVVRFEAPGFAPGLDTTVRVRPGQTLNLRFRAIRLPSVARPSPGAEVRHTVRLQRPESVQPGVAGTATAPAVLVVRTVGGWARIYVDGVLKRTGIAHRDTLPPGTHTLRLEREGYVTVDTLVTITMRRSGP